MSDEIRARRLIIEDENGNDRIDMFADDEGNVAINLNDSAGQRRTVVGLERDGLPLIALLDGNGTPAVKISTGKFDRPSIEFADAGGQCRLAIELTEAGQPSIEFIAPSTTHEEAWRLFSVELDEHDNAPVMLFRDAQGKVRLTIGFDDNGLPCVEKT